MVPVAVILPVVVILPVDMLPVVASTTGAHKDMYDLEILEQVIRFLSRRDLDLQWMGMRGMSWAIN
jgi:hypothetical protein